MSSNPEFRCNGRSQEALTAALSLGFGTTGHSKAEGYTVEPAAPEDGRKKAHGDRVVIYWHLSSSIKAEPIPFMSPLDAEGLTPVVWSWLKGGTWGPQPDHDGDNSKGWLVYTEYWGHIGAEHYAFLAVEREWIEYGK